MLVTKLCWGAPRALILHQYAIQQFFLSIHHLKHLHVQEIFMKLTDLMAPCLGPVSFSSGQVQGVLSRLSVVPGTEILPVGPTFLPAPWRSRDKACLSRDQEPDRLHRGYPVFEQWSRASRASRNMLYCHPWCVSVHLFWFRCEISR